MNEKEKIKLNPITSINNNNNNNKLNKENNNNNNNNNNKESNNNTSNNKINNLQNTQAIDNNNNDNNQNKNENVNTELENALISAIEFASKFRKGNEKKESNTEKEYKIKINKLEKDVIKSKQLVVKHVLASRKLQHILKQTIIINDGIIKYVTNIPNKKNIKVKRVKKQGLEEYELKIIDKIIDLIHGSSSMLQRSLRLYNDIQLTKELESFPIEQLSSMNEILFSRVAWISSGKRISISEGLRIFDLGSTFATIISKRNPFEPFDQVRWKVLKRMLKARLRIIYLAEMLHKYQLEKLVLENSGNNNNHINHNHHNNHHNNHLNSIRSNTAGSMFPSTSISISSALQSPTQKYRHSNSYSLQLSPETKINLNKKKDYKNNNNNNLNEVSFSVTLPNLQKQLTLSKSKQNDLTKKIQTNLSLVSQTVPIGSLKSAANYAKRVGANKVFSVLCIKARGYMKLVIEKLKQNVKMYELEIKSSQVQRLFGTTLMCSIFQTASIEKQNRYFQDWVLKLENLRDLEMYAAVIEIQRVGRGAIGRFQVRNRHKIKASKQIQRIVRGWLGRRKANILIYQRKLKWGVGVVERAWRKYRWFRTMRNLFILRNQTNATLLLQRVYRGYIGRKDAKKRNLLKRQNYGALKMQCLWRRYEAVILVDEYYRRWKEVEGAITIQAGIRGMLARKRVKRIRLWKTSASTIQRGVRCRQARDKVYHRRRYLASIMIQKHWRGYRTKKKVQKILLARRQARERAEYALNMIYKTIHGFCIRRKWGPQLLLFKQRRVDAMKKIKARYKAVKLGNADRRMIERWTKATSIIKRALKRFQQLCSDRAARLRLQNYSATKIQALYRGIKGREYAKYIWKLAQQRNNMKLPIYYRLKKMYYSDQNAFNGWAAIRIQSLMRKVLAIQTVQIMRMNHAATIIENTARKYLERKRAKEIVRQLKYALYYRDRMATRIQKRHRGILGRKLALKHRSSDILKWFLKETKKCGLPKRCFINFRIRKKHLERMELMAIKIQALARGYICRQRIRKIYKKLVIARDKRIFQKKTKAATKMQGMYRQWKSRKIVHQKKLEFMERERKRKQMEELDARLDDIHSSHLNDLLAVRVQQGVRSKLARNAKERQVQAMTYEQKERHVKKLNRSAIKIQAFYRGYRGRLKFKEMEPMLKKQLKARSFCVECEVNVAVKRCVECHEQFCNKCYDNIHRKGKRKDHGWVYIRAENQKSSNLSMTENPNLWQEYWDENARAKYWYHSVTGEATWICPY